MIALETFIFTICSEDKKCLLYVYLINGMKVLTKLQLCNVILKFLMKFCLSYKMLATHVLHILNEKKCD